MPRATDLDILDAIYHHAALRGADEGEVTAEEKQWADGVRDHIRSRIAEMARDAEPEEAAPAPSRKPIRAKYATMVRDAMDAAFEAIKQQRGGAMQVAFRKLSGLSDDDLRRLLDLLDPDSE